VPVTTAFADGGSVRCHLAQLDDPPTGRVAASSTESVVQVSAPRSPVRALEA
jgi:hypothetical protein